MSASVFKYNVCLIESDGEHPCLNLAFSLQNHDIKSIIGCGWRMPLAESICIKEGESRIRIITPDDDVIVLEKGTTGYTSIASGVVAKKDGQILHLTYPCGWTLEYRQGRLIKMTAPTGAYTSFKYLDNGVALSNKDGLFMSVCKVSDEGGTRVEVKKKLQSMVSINLIQDDPAVSSGRLEIKTKDGSIRKFSQNNTSLIGDGIAAEWNNAGSLIRLNDKIYSAITVEGVPCVKVVDKDGQYSLSGETADVIVRKHHQGPINITSLMPGRNLRSPRFLKTVDETGKLLLRKSFIYDENRKAIQVVTSTPEQEDVIVAIMDNITVAKTMSGKFIYQTTRNNDGSIKQLKTALMEVNIEYTSAHTANLEIVKNKKKKRATLPLSQLQILVNEFTS